MLDLRALSIPESGSSSPILSLGKLNATHEVYMKGGDGGKLYFPLNEIEVEICKVKTRTMFLSC